MDFWKKIGAMGTRLAPLAAVAASPIFKLTMMESAVVARSTTTVTAASAANLWPFNSNPQLHHSHRYSENPELSAAQWAQLELGWSKKETSRLADTKYS